MWEGTPGSTQEPLQAEWSWATPGDTRGPRSSGNQTLASCMQSMGYAPACWAASSKMFKYYVSRTQAYSSAVDVLQNKKIDIKFYVPIIGLRYETSGTTEEVDNLWYTITCVRLSKQAPSAKKEKKKKNTTKCMIPSYYNNKGKGGGKE